MGPTRCTNFSTELLLITKWRPDEFEKSYFFRKNSPKSKSKFQSTVTSWGFSVFLRPHGLCTGAWAKRTNALAFWTKLREKFKFPLNPHVNWKSTSSGRHSRSTSAVTSNEVSYDADGPAGHVETAFVNMGQLRKKLPKKFGYMYQWRHKHLVHDLSQPIVNRFQQMIYPLKGHNGVY